MKASTRLDSAVFQLTPTRTRCDLLISANGKTEKIASGLVNPFLAHLKTAQDQMAKGGYSIILKPEAGDDTTWFTKGTFERFVRFVSTPEVLERVYTIESEILQIKEAITIQTNGDMGTTTVEDRRVKTAESIAGSRPLLEPNEEKAIVLYEPASHPLQANGSTVPEENSKVQVLKVLETRKTALQKEQGMAFARAVAAGFGIDDMAPLISFAKMFGASRLMDACVKFMDLWKKKHETGQWLEIEATEALAMESDINTMNESGIVFANAVNRQRDSWPGTPESGKPSRDANADAKSSVDNKSTGHQEHLQGQFPQPMFAPWPIHSPPGGFPVFQGYPMQGMPYYPGFPGNSPYQSPYSAEDPRFNSGQRKVHRRHSMDSEDSVSENVEIAKATSEDAMELEQSREQRKRSGRLGRKKSGMVVIRNINYITSNKQNSSGSDSQPTSDTDGDEEGMKQGQTKSVERLTYGKEREVEATEAESEHWKAFQNFLLRDADREECVVDQGMYTMEKDARVKRRQSAAGDDPLAYAAQIAGHCQEGNLTDLHKMNGSMSRRLKGSNDGLVISGRPSMSGDSGVYSQMDVQVTEVDGKRPVYRRTGNDDFIIHKRENHSGFTNSSDPLAVSSLDHANNGLDKRSQHNMDDDSYIVSSRPVSNDRNAIDMGSEIPSSQQKDEKISRRINYEPDDLSLMPERGIEKTSIGYDPALDYELQAHVGDGGASLKKNEVADLKQGTKKSEKDPKSRFSLDSSDKKKASGPIRKGRPTKLSPLDEARARAEKLRTFKADLQKMKREKENEEKKRIEALKIARQKRIAARSTSGVAQSSMPSQQSRKQVPTKLSPGTCRGSKFSDSEPGSASPLHGFPIRTASLGSSDSSKVNKPGKSSTSSAGNRLTRSVSSLLEPKKGNSTTPETKVSMSRIRRLSEPKMSSSAPVSSLKSRGTGSSKRVSDRPESKKISAIVNHDKTKTASLPELKIKTSKGPNIAPAKSSAKETMEKVNQNGSLMSKIEEKASFQNDEDETPVIEKTVVMLECQKPRIPAVQASVKNTGLEHKKPEVITEYPTIHAPVSPPTMEGVDKETVEQSQESPNANDILLIKVENLSDLVTETPKFPTSQSVAQNPYQAPYARLSSMEDSCTQNSEYIRSPPTSIQNHTKEPETVNALASDSNSSKLEKIPEASDKSQTKESSKGLRKLLKFGRKTHSSATGEHSIDLDNVANGSEGSESAANTATSSEVFTLKNLISQDETPTAAAAPPKSSRHFSLLSPFKSKTTEKKQAS